MVNTSIGKLYLICTLLLSTHALHTAPFVYLSNTGSNNVTVIDAADNSTSTVDLQGNTPSGQIATDGKTVYIPCYNNPNGTLQRIDVATKTLLPPISLGTLEPFGIAIAPNDLYVYVSGTDFTSLRGVVQKINIATTAVETIFVELNILAFFIAISPNGSTAYVTISETMSGGNIVSIDLDTNMANIAYPNLLDNIGPLIVSPDNTYLYVSSNVAGGYIRQFDISTPLMPVEVQDIPYPSFTGFHPFGLAITPDGNTMYVSSSGTPSGIGTIDIEHPLSPTTGTIVSDPTIVAPFYLALTPDSTSLYAASSGNGMANVINTTNALNPTFTTSVTAGTNPFGVAITPLLPPSSASGCKTRNKFLLQTDYINNITWTAPSTSLSPAPASYNIYRDAALTQLVANVPASGTLQYYDHGRQPNVTYTYYITSVGTSGIQSAATSVTVTQNC
jgi:hypothetical protein